MTLLFTGPMFHRTAVRGAVRRAAVVPALALCCVTALSGCGKSIQIADTDTPASASSSPAAPSGPASSAPAGSASASPSTTAPGNAGLQVIDSTAEQAGLNGDGGTVVGAAVQETPPQWVQLSAVTSGPLSAPHLININQAVLYRFDDDTASPSRSACNSTCAQKWPPVTVQESGKVYMAGVKPTDVGAIRRQDGQIQLTVGGWPLYRFAGDSKPGDLKGQGADGKWFAVSPTGEKATGGQ